MLLPVVINIISIQVAARVNNVAVFTEIIGTVVFGVLLFVLWGVKSKPSPYGFGILGNTTSVYHNPTIYAFALAGLIGAFTLVGFELAADMSEAVEAAPLPLLAIAGYWLAYSMSRDNMLPCSGTLRKVNARTQTPIIALLVLAVIVLFWRLRRGAAGVKPIETLTGETNA